MSGSIQQAYPIGRQVVELVGPDEQLVASRYCASVEIPLEGGGPASGEVLSLALLAYEGGTGSVLPSQGKLYLFESNPSVALGDTALAAAGVDHQECAGVVAIATADWVTDTNGAIAYKQVAIPFRCAGSLWASFFLLAAETTINSDAGDEEHLDLRITWRRDQ